MKSNPQTCQSEQESSAFTLTELLAVVAVLAVLALTALPARARAKTQPNAKAAVCQNNLRQLMVGWRMYAEDNLGRVINNFGLSEIMSEISGRTYRNWANNVMSWSTDQAVTNQTLLKVGILGTYYRGDTAIYKCPADNYVSAAQRSLGYANRTRSFSMNAFFGPNTANPNDVWASGRNTYFSNYRQWLKVTDVRKPDSYFVLIEEHPDSINDGLFINNPITAPSQWGDMPGSFHNGAVNLSFAGGHTEVHQWKSLTTKVPVRFGYLPRSFDAAGYEDYQWLMDRMAALY